MIRIEAPQCEHCGDYLDQVYMKTTETLTLTEEGVYMNLQKNWDQYGYTVFICPNCNRQTDGVEMDEDGKVKIAKVE